MLKNNHLGIGLGNSQNASEVSAQLAERMAELARDLAGEPSQRGRAEWRFRARGSLAVVITGPKRGQWFDHEAGQGGDALGLVAHLRGVPMREAWRWASGWLGTSASAPVPAAPPRAVAPRERPREACAFWRSLWAEALAADAPGSLVPIYLASRGLALDPDAPLRFHPRCPRGGSERLPAMLALMTDPVTGEPCGIHRTFLAADGHSKADGEAKMMIGRAGVVRLVPDDEVMEGLGIAEGIETALAVMQRTGWRPVWAATSAGAIARFPVLAGIESLTVFADADGAGMDAARECCVRWAAASLWGAWPCPEGAAACPEARILAPPAGDWDNALPRGRAA